MSLSPGRGGLVPFRLSDVPPEIRERAKTRLLKAEDSPSLRVLIGIAADAPSDRLYWMTREAWDAAVSSTSWKRGRDAAASRVSPIGGRT